MANNVFANGMEVSCKAGSGKSIACLPDVCMTPPENPATPPGVPVPYPNTGQASDSTSGTRNVKISKKEASIKNSSYFKKSMGDEAGSAAKKGVISSKNRGKVYFTAWSMDVKFEGENAVRNLDMTTHNHGSPTNTGPWPFIDGLDVPPPGHPCEGVSVEFKLVPYKTGDEYTCAPQTGHHIIPGRCLRNQSGYSHSKAPVVCVEGRSQYMETHKKCHEFFDPIERWHHENNEPFEYERARYAAALSVAEATDPPGELTDKELECVEAQLDAYYKDDPNGPQCDDSTDLRSSGARGKVNDLYATVEDKFG